MRFALVVISAFVAVLALAVAQCRGSAVKGGLERRTSNAAMVCPLMSLPQFVHLAVLLLYFTALVQKATVQAVIVCESNQPLRTLLYVHS